MLVTDFVGLSRAIQQTENQKQPFIDLFLPSIELARKRGILCTSTGIRWWKVLGQDQLREDIGADNHKGLAIGQPSDNLGERWVAQNGQQTLRENLSFAVSTRSRSGRSRIARARSADHTTGRSATALLAALVVVADDRSRLTGRDSRGSRSFDQLGEGRRSFHQMAEASDCFFVTFDSITGNRRHGVLGKKTYGF